ncbi:hypothetical protein DOJK_00831 [Patescibacteria group bacterium]|nr:hypothetical protein [Candidatus Dojkabacteria bacterium]CAG1021189.1 hypothetical protein DOJK_00831 [Patescibacteria group bacterium]
MSNDQLAEALIEAYKEYYSAVKTTVEKSRHGSSFEVEAAGYRRFDAEQALNTALASAPQDALRRLEEYKRKNPLPTYA